MKTSGNRPLNRYVKIEGHTNWFLVIEAGQKEPEGLSEKMHERILEKEMLDVFNPVAKIDYVQRITFVSERELNYESLAKKCGTILVRPHGSFTTLQGNVITNETFDTNFPIEDFSEIVICENSDKAEVEWIEYLKERFEGKKIVTINFFNLRDEKEIEQYFEKAKYITFSTTFSKYEWFEKLSKYANHNHQIIGFCHSKEKWSEALEINDKVEIVERLNKTS